MSRAVSLWDGGTIGLTGANAAQQDTLIDNIFGITEQSIYLQKLETAATAPDAYLQARRGALNTAGIETKTVFRDSYARYIANPYNLSEREARDLAINDAKNAYSSKLAAIEARYPSYFGEAALRTARAVSVATPMIQSIAMLQGGGFGPPATTVVRRVRSTRRRTRRHRRHRK